MSFKYIKEYSNYSTEYYNDFDENWFPTQLIFKTQLGTVTFDRKSLVPSSNRIFLEYHLENNDSEQDNPYGGELPDTARMDVGITYSSSEKDNKKIKIQVTITGGSRDWINFVYEDDEVYHISETNVELVKGSWENVMEMVKKLSEVK